MSESVQGTRSGAKLLVDCLERQGVDRIFCVPGESYLAVLDALVDQRDKMDLVVCRQEGGASNMADAYAKLTGKPGVCFVTRGPGATNASIGVHTAFQDSTPMVLFIGQVARGFRDREGFQEVDLEAMFRPLAKWTARIDDARRLPEYVHRAFQTALSGRPGPVVLSLPEDMLTDLVDASTGAGKRAHPVPSAPTADALEHYATLLSRAKRPLMIVGGGEWSRQVGDDVLAHAEAQQIPLCASLRCQDFIPNSHPLYAGHFGIGAEPSLTKHLQEADLVIVLGARLGEMTTAGYTLLEAPQPRQALIHIYPEPSELGRVYQADLPINAGAAPMARALRALAPSEAAVDRADWCQSLRADYEASCVAPDGVPGVDLAAIVQQLQKALPADTIVSNGAGNYTGWIHKYWSFDSFRSQLAPTSGAMGYGVPAAVAAKLTYPDRSVLSVSGDGCFLMNAQELATAVQYGARILFIVVNNNAFGTIRLHQEREYPTRVSGTTLLNPDFAALARAFGLAGERVTDNASFGEALNRVLANPVGGLIEIVTDVENLSARSTLSSVRNAALARQA
ncbi:thiamine pyrophosphate-binding protein [Variovorax ginsengisoli]|uniref:Thiamine pyrophosphate-binding protein n=1 Tax=Variovorax ginsengisoli TaxID=363844 RepID=A0ABT8SEL9_9BURK|nr:thiamine pyrophosphate-binding protein [Variovorax ginsengisoli]MDN8618199.1 thiamine pyrophosphate-binding protein [Variovorax ginsengisoli]MDO1537369.1 thiamine pyrophosphate-binding protein [Variovorax ginsengisoli]